jgi:hypothetical protein
MALIIRNYFVERSKSLHDILEIFPEKLNSGEVIWILFRVLFNLKDSFGEGRSEI